MNSAPSDGAALIAALESSQDVPGLYQRFSSFFRPFGEFVFLENYDPRELPSKEKIRPIARQFHQFLCKALKLIPDLLKRSPSEEGVDEERAAELLGIYRLTIHCLLCIAPCLAGQPYSVHLQWGQLVRRLESWGMYSDAEEEGFDILESISAVLLASKVTSKPPAVFLPDPSVVGSAGEDPQLACLITEVVIVLTNCIFKSQSKDNGAYERLLELAKQVKPWLG
ncbi:separase [Apostasia shenzhenica]|uniref:Separase n=1 Tax=Apostasia shenzhenica TaxID=1088818 RepID=A0A2I0A5X6_9ASPA|nr:separase [Apostasia shenzhenica]